MYCLHLDHLSLVLENQIQTVEYQDHLANLERMCQIEHNGTVTVKYLQLLVMRTFLELNIVMSFLQRTACKHFDKGKGFELIRLAEDGPPVDSSPHIYAELVNKDYVCELWVENEKLFGNLSLPAAISSFFHLCFVAHLKYPKGAEFVADLLQTVVAKYGDKSGTRTWSKAASAEKKRDAFFALLGRIMAS